jgi:bifunctional DNA-binding transcriptional regulator/antitoxin component of YhaV-PrlF toxin-antitoxin module
MNDMFKAKIRKIGSSYGILIPKEQLAAMDVKEGDEIDVAILRHRNEKAIEEGLGMGKGSKPFVRDKRDRY